MSERYLPNNPTWLPVVCVAIQDSAGRVLMHRRPPGKPHAGLWEFPGGKVEPTETPGKAVLREIAEELGIALDPFSLEACVFAELDAPEVERPIVLMLYTASRWSGEPRSREGGACGWFSWKEAAGLPMPPLDRKLFVTLGKIKG